MPKTVIINESTLKRVFTDQILEESDISKEELSKMVKDSLKTDKDVNDAIERKVKSLVASAVNTLFRTLWQRRNFYEDEIKK
jgi:hypothetical protein